MSLDGSKGTFTWAVLGFGYLVDCLFKVSAIPAENYRDYPVLAVSNKIIVGSGVFLTYFWRRFWPSAAFVVRPTQFETEPTLSLAKKIFIIPAIIVAALPTRNV